MPARDSGGGIEGTQEPRICPKMGCYVAKLTGNMAERAMI